MGSFEMNGKHKYECEPHNAQTHLKVIFKGVGSIFYISIHTFFFLNHKADVFFTQRRVGGHCWSLFGKGWVYRKYWADDWMCHLSFTVY